MQTVSQSFKDALNGPIRTLTDITVTTPDGASRLLDWASGSVSSSNSTGVRMSATLEVIPELGVDLYSILSTPGAIYTIEHGIDYGAGFTETIPLGVYEAASGGIDIIDGTIDLSLVDKWDRIERCRFLSPYSPGLDVNPPPTENRAEMIQNVVTATVLGDTPWPGNAVEVRATGGSTNLTDRVWDRDRTEFIADISKDGELDVYFDASGVLVIRTEPIVDPSASVWTFRTGEFGNIVTANRERPFDRLYNAVVVNPVDETQEWGQVVVQIEDTTNPRHRNYIGTVPYFFSSPTLTTANAAESAANTLLQRVQGTTETLSLGVLPAPLLEVGDTVTAVHTATDSDPGLNAVHIVDSWAYDLTTGAMTCATRSSSLAEVEET